MSAKNTYTNKRDRRISRLSSKRNLFAAPLCVLLFSLSGLEGNVFAQSCSPVGVTSTPCVVTGNVDSIVISAPAAISNTQIAFYQSSGNIVSLTNNGNLTGSSSALQIAGAITTLNNNGNLTLGGVGGIALSAVFVGDAASVKEFNNAGSIAGNRSMYVSTSGVIETLNNTGTIVSSSVSLTNQGTVGTINNTGTITNLTPATVSVSGINNSGVINTLNNRQGALSSPLSVNGYLPNNYNIIISSTTNYGQLNGKFSTGNTIFGISPLSVTTGILNTQLNNVLLGITPQSLGLPSTATSLSGNSNGYSYTLTEVPASLGVLPNGWNLIITGYSANAATSSATQSNAVSNITAGTTATLIGLGGVIRPILDGGLLSLNTNDKTALTFTITDQGGTIRHASIGTAILEGIISGTGRLRLTGTGLTYLTAGNTYVGGTTVDSGTLAVAGQSATGSGEVLILSAATLMGTGTIPGNITIAGILKPGNSPGYLAAGQNVTMTAGSTYQQDIAGKVQASTNTPVGSTGYYSFLDVAGQLTIAPGATLAPKLQNLFQTTESGFGSAPYVPSLGDNFRIASAAGGISGTFSSVTQPAGLADDTQFIAFYNYGGSNSIDLSVIPTSYARTLSGANSNTRSVAGALDQLTAAQFAATANGTQTSLMYSTASQTAASLPGFAQSLAGEIHGATLAVVPQAAQRVQTAAMMRLGDTSPSAQNSGAQVSNASSISANNPSGMPTAAVSSNPSVNPVTDLQTPYRPNVWGEVSYQYGNRSSDSNASGYNSNQYQAVFGADIFKESGTKLGAGFSLSTTNVTMNQGTGTVGQGSLFVYGKTPVMQDYVLDGMVSVGLNSTDTSRNDPTTSTNLKTKGVTGNDLLVSMGLSRTFETEDLAITPYVRATWQMVNQTAFDEGSASAAALNVNSYSGNGARGLLGVTLGSKNKNPMKEAYTFKANLAVGADSNTLINPSLNANLAGFGTTIQSANVGSTFVQAGLYGTVKFADNAYAYAGVTGETRSGQTLGGVNVGLRMQF